VSLQTPCDFAKARYLDISWLRKLWGYLWIVLGASTAIFLCVTIIFFLRSSWLPAALSTLGTVVNGAAMTWITTQRKTAADEEQQAFDELVQQCSSPSAPKFLREAPANTTVDDVRQTKWFQALESAAQSGKTARAFLASLRRH
jgi:hypothetical protein